MYYVTTPIYYVNDQPHIGHVYTTTVADVLARHHRLRGEAVFFLTGTDEHAAKVVDAAQQRNLTPQAWADQNAASFQQTFAKLEMTHDDFIRTSENRHTEKVTRYVAALIEHGHVYLGEYEGWYDPGEEEYIPQKRAEECGYKSPISGRDLVRKSEQNYFFRLSAYRDRLREHFEAHPRFVQPEARRKEILNRIADAEDVPISRTGQIDWGIQVPGDESHTIYVWIDALFNYLTTVDTDERRQYWQSGAVHLIAKDILWFHAAIWPAVLMALRECPGYDWVNLPEQIYAHSFWIAEGQKMSKSLGNFIDLAKIDHYVHEFSLDALRYFLAVKGPMGTTDSDFADAAFIDTYNSDLANTFGNCASRVSNMIGKYFEGRAPQPGANDVEGFDWPDLAAQAVQRSEREADVLSLSGMSDAGMELVRSIDGYIEATQPFKLAKDESKLPQVGAILYNCAEALRIASLLLWPAIPGKVEELWRRFGLDYAEQMTKSGGCGDLSAWSTWGRLEPGTTIEKGQPLFPRYQPAAAS
jgi:methionyl-tRNA synthetase